MRNNPTEPEHRLWKALRARQFFGYKFRRQMVIGNRIVDLFCPAKGMIIELDGNTHDPETDARRDAKMLSDSGFRTLRFTNLEVMHNCDGVLLALQIGLEQVPDRWAGRLSIQQQESTTSLSPLKRRGRRQHDLKAPSSLEEGVGGGDFSGLPVPTALREADKLLSATSDTPRLDAELLMAHALGVSRTDLVLRCFNDQVPDQFSALIARRLAHEPVAYILGGQEFYGLAFTVTPDVLIPRGDSEVLVERALAARPDAKRVLDCGTGSGALLLAALANLPNAQGVGIDRSPAALAIASENARKLNLAQQAKMLQGDWHEAGWADSLGQFDLILANPPYVEDQAVLSPSVKEYEPAGALFAGPEGLDDYRVLIPQIPALLMPCGAAFVEIGYLQAEAVMAIAAEVNLTATLHNDLAGRARVLELVYRN